MSPETDMQARQISAGLTKLQELLDNPVATSSLELGKNATAASQYDILRRLKKSLLQYLERGGNLFYVGVLGHFSAGKSSTINSLLDAWASKNERKTSLNPTDTTITLITQEKNNGSLLGVIREGHVPIRLQTIESPLLDQLVLVDTPGTGDPQFIAEVARDFLPICDVILFVLSAASPLDKSDVPLLAELHKRLPFIPLHFVVTRSDELRLNPNQPLTEANLDEEKTRSFLEVIVSRVNALLTPQVYLANNFTLIDNKSKFRINQLASFLSARCDASSPQAHISMHMNKLHFFLKGAKELRSFFAGILDSKLADLSSIVQAAARNIERYQRIVQISNNNLTKNWMESAAIIGQAGSRAADALGMPTTLPAELASFTSVSAERSEILKDLLREAKFNASSVSVGLRSQVNAELQDHFFEVQKKISDTPLQELTASDHGVSSIDLLAKLNSSDLLSPASLARRWDALREAEAGALREIARDLRRLLKDLEDVVNQRAPLVECEQVIEGAIESLKTDLSQFFQNVELYRSGVFSHTTKESIATLGIGQRLDTLEAEFTEDDKGTFTADAVRDLFPGVHQSLTAAGARIAAMAPKVRPLVEAARHITIERPDENHADIEQDFATARSVLQSELQRQLKSDVDQFCSAVNVGLASVLVTAKSEYRAQIQKIQSARLKRYGIAFGVTAALCGAAFLAYSHHRRPAPTSTVGEIILSIFCGLAVEGVVLLIVKWRENMPEQVAETKEEVRVKLADAVRQVTDVSLRNHRFDALDEFSIASRVNQIYANALSTNTDSWKSRAGDILSSIHELQGHYIALRGEHITFINELRDRSSEYFTDASRNLSVLNDVAGRIKERAIEPSFALLDQTREELLSVKTQVIGVQFD